jgi:excisionase family DNA binding protein
MPNTSQIELQMTASQEQHSDEYWPSLLSIALLAKLLGVSKRTVHRWNSSEEIPRAVFLGGTPRWRYEEIVAWTTSGCPRRDRWERDCKGNLRNIC